MKFVCTADTHGFHEKLTIPDGDVFIFAGDMADRNDDLISFNQFLEKLPHKYKIIIAGNHDFLWEMKYGSLQSIITNGFFLENTEIDIEGVKIWGMPWLGKTSLIPEGIDILVTHIPPFGHGDLTRHGRHLGSKDLLEVIRRVKPKYHIFGHIHEGYGLTKEIVGNDKIVCMNVSAIVGFRSNCNPPMTFEYRV